MTSFAKNINLNIKYIVGITKISPKYPRTIPVAYLPIITSINTQTIKEQKYLIRTYNSSKFRFPYYKLYYNFFKLYSDNCNKKYLK